MEVCIVLFIDHELDNSGMISRGCKVIKVTYQLKKLNFGMLTLNDGIFVVDQGNSLKF